MRKQNKTLTCPECNGKPIEWEPCYYCDGYGYQTDEDDSYEQFKGRE